MTDIEVFDEVVTICGEVIASCVCVKPKHKETEPHVCECLGSWNEVNGVFICYALPLGQLVPKEDLDEMLRQAGLIEVEGVIDV